MEQRDDRLPLRSEDGGDLNGEPRDGMTDDPLVASEEGVPYDPPNDRVLSDTRDSGSSVEQAGTDPTDAGELERDDMIQPPDGEMPADDELRADVIETLRASNVPAGDHLRVAVNGSRVMLAGEVESIDVLDEILGIVGDVPGVTDVVDEVKVSGI